MVLPQTPRCPGAYAFQSSAYCRDRRCAFAGIAVVVPGTMANTRKAEVPVNCTPNKGLGQSPRTPRGRLSHTLTFPTLEVCCGCQHNVLQTGGLPRQPLVFSQSGGVSRVGFLRSPSPGSVGGRPLLRPHGVFPLCAQKLNLSVGPRLLSFPGRTGLGHTLWPILTSSPLWRFSRHILSRPEIVGLRDSPYVF